MNLYNTLSLLSLINILIISYKWLTRQQARGDFMVVLDPLNSREAYSVSATVYPHFFGPKFASFITNHCCIMFKLYVFRITCTTILHLAQCKMHLGVPTHLSVHNNYALINSSLTLALLNILK